MKPNHDHLVLILDRSGSMQAHWSDTVGAGRQFLADQAKVEGRAASVTFVAFDDRIEQVAHGQTLDEEFAKTVSFPAPRGSTALLDVVGTTILSVGGEIDGRPEGAKPENVIVVILTDGHENASKEFTLARVKEMIEHQQSVYNWRFVFLGADITAVSVGASMGVSIDSSVQYGTGNYAGAFANTSNAVARSRNSGTTVAFTDEERAAVL